MDDRAVQEARQRQAEYHREAQGKAAEEERQRSPYFTVRTRIREHARDPRTSAEDLRMAVEIMADKIDELEGREGAVRALAEAAEQAAGYLARPCAPDSALDHARSLKDCSRTARRALGEVLP